jgi:proteasome lid subunit RPN8/RPN11
MIKSACVGLSEGALFDLTQLGWDDQRELGGTLLGEINESPVRAYIDRVLENPGGPEEPYRTSIDAKAHLDKQRYRTLADPAAESVVVGCVHSHVNGVLRASDADLDALEENSRALGAWCSLIVGPTERWAAGYPFMDWQQLRIAAWIAVNGEISTAIVLAPPRESRGVTHA